MPSVLLGETRSTNAAKRNSGFFEGIENKLVVIEDRVVPANAEDGEKRAEPGKLLGPGAA